MRQPKYMITHKTTRFDGNGKAFAASENTDIAECESLDAFVADQRQRYGEEDVEIQVTVWRTNYSA